MAKPFRIDPQTAMQLTFNPRQSVQIGGIWGTIRPGQNYQATDGLRQVVDVGGYLIFYYQNNALWGQQTQSFIDEIRTYPLIRGAQRAVGMAKLAEFQVNMLLGIVAGSSGIGMLAVVGVDIFKFLVMNKDNFNKWLIQMQAFLKVRERLKAKAPILYEKIFEMFLKQLWIATKKNIPAATTQPHVVGKLIGIMLGKFGKAAVRSRLTILGTIWIILSNVTSKIITSTPSAIRITSGAYKQLAIDLLSQLRKIGITISEREAQQIFQEIAKHPNEIRDIFRELQAAFGSQGSAKAAKHK